MEPIKGGKLAVTPPREIQEIWSKAEIIRTPAEWALRWVWNQPEVSVVLSGMSDMSQVKQNIDYANFSCPEILREDELLLYDEVREAYNNLGFIGCTACEYCLPCPENVQIPKILGLYNEYYLLGRPKNFKDRYWKEITSLSHASNCISCANCEQKCPQNLPIRKFMNEVIRMFPKSD